VSNASVVGVQSRLHSDYARAYVTPDARAPRPAMQGLIQFARARIAYNAPEEIIVLDKMPLDATGKFDRATLKKKWAAHRRGPAAWEAG